MKNRTRIQNRRQEPSSEFDIIASSDEGERLLRKGDQVFLEQTTGSTVDLRRVDAAFCRVWLAAVFLPQSTYFLFRP